MKQNQNKRANYNAKQPLSKKQRKKLEKRGVSVKTRAEREKMPREKKWLISLVAAVCVMAIACASFGTVLLARVIGDALGDPTASVYESIKLNKHLDTNSVNEKFYKNNIFDFSKIEANESYKPLTLADMDSHIKSVLVSNRTLKKELQKQTVIGLGDTVYLYVTDLYKGEPKTAAEKEANRLTVPIGSTLEELFGTYTSNVAFVVGSEYFGADFDDKLIAMGLKPTDTAREVRMNGDVALTDTVCITYWFQKSKGASSTPYAEKLEDRYNWSSSAETAYTKYQARVDLDEDLDERFAQALVDNCLAIGESFTFVLEDYNLTGGSKESDRKSDYKVTAQIMYVSTEEITKDITFRVDDSYFGEDDGDFYALNGETVTMSVTVLYTDDYEVPTFDRKFITETLKMDVTATDDAGAIAEYKEKELVILNEARAKNKKNAQYSAALSHLVTKATSSSYFLDSTSNSQELYAAAVEQVSRNLLERFLAAYGYPPTTVELNEYAVMLAKLSGVTVSGADEYVSAVVSSEAANMKKTALMTYHIFREEGMKITDSALDAAYAEYMADLIDSMQDPETHNEAYFTELYGEDVIKSWVRRDLVYKMVGDYLLKVNSQSFK